MAELIGLETVFRRFLASMSGYFNNFWLNLHIPPWLVVAIMSFGIAWYINSRAKIRFGTFFMAALFYAAFLWLGFAA